MWGEVLDADQGDGVACNPACGVEASDEASFIPRVLNKKECLKAASEPVKGLFFFLPRFRRRLERKNWIYCE